MQAQELYWIWLSLSLDHASKSVKQLLELFDMDPERIYQADEQEYANIKTLTTGEKNRLCNKNLTPAQETLAYCKTHGVSFLVYGGKSYPKSLTELVDPPVLLYFRGKLPPWNTFPCIAVVGTRTMSRYGGNQALEISYDLGRIGCITVSGMALGVDAVCAAATLEAGAPTVAVLGSGIDEIYPKSHFHLYHSIIQRGGIVLTEFPPYAKPEAYHFPLRNRIISGLSHAVIVVEGNAKSGALITAECAKKQGKLVFAIPGSVNDENCEGPLILLKNGALPLTCADDIYDKFHEEYPLMNPFHLLKEERLDLNDVIWRYAIDSYSPQFTPRKRTKVKKTTGDVGMVASEPSFFRRQIDNVQQIVQMLSPKKKEVTPSSPSSDEDLTLDEDAKASKKQILSQLNETERKVFSAMPEDTPVTAEELVVDGISFGEIASVLATMEICGYVFSASGGRYIKRY